MLQLFALGFCHSELYKLIYFCNFNYFFTTAVHIFMHTLSIFVLYCIDADIVLSIVPDKEANMEILHKTNL